MPSGGKALLAAFIVLTSGIAFHPGMSLPEVAAQSTRRGTSGPAHAPLIGRTPEGGKGQEAEAEILWDRWGTPHIFAGDVASAFRAFGWAQARSHPELLLRLYGHARGRASEYFGERELASDRAVRIMGHYARAGSWYKDLSPQFRANLDAFASGINDFARDNPDGLSVEAKAVLPVNGVDVVAHTILTQHFALIEASGLSQALPAGVGSNGWAIAPSRSEDGHALLLLNPHLPWSIKFFEAQVAAPGYDAYGATLLGLPVLMIAFNDHLGWTHTVNTIDPGDLYELTLEGDGYRYGKSVRPFEVEHSTIRVKQADATFKEVPLEVRRSVHGPVVEKDGKTYALRVAGLQVSSFAGLSEQWWEMGRARNLAEFRAALGRHQLPMLNVIYADAAGHIMGAFGGFVPVRNGGDTQFWSKPVPGNDPDLLWTKIHPLADLPAAVDPPSGWVQNCNDVPWGMTEPRLDPLRYPAYMAPRGLVPRGHLREQRSIRMIKADPRISLAEFIAYRNSTRSELADRVLDELIDAAGRHGDASARKAAEVLKRWDRETNAESRGAFLFATWAMALLNAGDLWKFPFDPARPLETPSGLKDPGAAARVLAEAANRIEAAGVELDVPWGQAVRMRHGAVDLPAAGGSTSLGIVRNLFLTPASDGRWEATGGDSFIAAVEFSRPPKAKVLQVAGNSSAPGSPHDGDQLTLYARKQMRDAWRSRAEIEANLELRTVFAGDVIKTARAGAR